MRMKILIILTITLILFTSYYYGIVIFAEGENNISDCLITEVGTNINELLKYKDYVVVNNEVNINQPGIYKVIYRHVNTNEEIIKTVHVIEKDRKAYFYEELIYKESDNTAVFNVKDVFCHMNKPNTLFTYQVDGKSSINFINGEIDKGIHYGNDISWYCTGDLFDSTVYNNICYFLGTDKNVMNNKPEIRIYKKSTNIEKNYKVAVTGSFDVSSITTNGKYCYITGYTNETSTDFPGIRKGNDSFLLIYNLENELIENIVMIPLTGDDEIKEIIYYQGYLYMIQTSKSKVTRLIKMDIFGNTILEQDINLQYGFYDVIIKLINNELFLAYTKYDYEQMDYIGVINKFNEQLELTEVYNKYFPGMKLIDFNIDDGIKYILLNNIKNNTGYEYLVYDSKNELLGSYKSTSNDLIKGLTCKNVIVGTSNDKRTLKYYQINSLIKIKEPNLNVYYELSKEQNDNNINDYTYLINGNKAKHCELSKIEYDQNVFGNYEISMYFNDYFDYYKEYSVNVLPFCGVKANQTYDLGLTIHGNGTMYVNNLLIEKDYSFNEPGEYEIKLIGKDNQIEVYKIKVDDISINFEDLVVSEKLEIDEFNNPSIESTQINTTFTENTVTNVNKKTSSFLYLVPAVTLGVAILFIKWVI